MIKNYLPMQDTQETWIQFLSWEDPWSRKSQSALVFLENSMDRGFWQAIVYRFTKHWTCMSMHMHTCTCTANYKIGVIKNKQTKNDA